MNKNVKNIKRKKRMPRLPIGLFISLTVLLAISIACIIIIIVNNVEQSRASSAGAAIYFFDSQAYGLKPEHRQFIADSDTDKIKFVLEELSIGPKNAALQASVPRDIIKSASVSGDNVDVTVSGDYLTLSKDEEMICRSAIVSTLTDLPFVKTVTINVDGNELLKPNGQIFGKMKEQDVVIIPDINQKETPKTITLYFADSTNTGLVAESRTISINPNDSIAKYIVTELIKGPTTEGLLPTVPPETKLLGLDVLEGVCNVDLSKEFINKHTGGPGTERLSIYSIVNSLCEQSDIKSVQFLIESKRQEQFKGETGFNNLYEEFDMPPVQ